jgi:hypothetical protein
MRHAIPIGQTGVYWPQTGAYSVPQVVVTIGSQVYIWSFVPHSTMVGGFPFEQTQLELAKFPVAHIGVGGVVLQDPL